MARSINNSACNDFFVVKCVSVITSPGMDCISSEYLIHAISPKLSDVSKCLFNHDLI